MHSVAQGVEWNFVLRSAQRSYKCHPMMIKMGEDGMSGQVIQASWSMSLERCDCVT
jgi:hypothetical protein